ncbi:MAG: ATP-binding protein [Bacteroidales bacterium]|nr:ATP-binding protein [Bacteroidales bacterium]
MIIERTISKALENELLESNKIVVLYGARQTGKTTISNAILEKLKGKQLKINADEIRYIDILSSRDFQKMRLLIEGYDILFIDEAQRIPEIGINLKIIIDKLPEMKILVTGSSSFDLASKVKEPLTGRTLTHTLYPISLGEYSKYNNLFDIQSHLEELMTYGMYPGILLLKSGIQKEKYLRELSSSYLYKDIFELSSIRNTSLITDLLKLLALQIGNEVSINELAKNLKISQETVNSYINLLEKAFIIFRLNGFNRNLRKEVSKRDKIYFWDLGIRNAIINNFSNFNIRNDIGAIWENFIITERIKYLSNNGIYSSSYFWRTYTGAEIDYVEEVGDKLFAFEIKYKKARKKAPQTWTDNYGNNFKSITSENFWEFVL